MSHTSKALVDGSPIFINPVVDIEHYGGHTGDSVLLTLPEIPNQETFCSIENLTPVKFNLSNICYIGPITKQNLVLLRCPLKF